MITVERAIRNFVRFNVKAHVPKDDLFEGVVDKIGSFSLTPQEVFNTAEAMVRRSDLYYYPNAGYTKIW